MTLLVNRLRVERAGRIVLRDISFEARAGRILVVMGPNGAGKTTLLDAVAGLLRTVRGSVLFAGEALHALKPAALAARRAVMTQHFDCPFAYAVEDVVALGRLCHAGTPRAARDGAALAAALAAADIGPLARRPITTLSGGERQRVAFAKAVAQLFDRAATGEPHLLILDEPVASLDPEHQHRLLQQARLLAAGGATVVVTLHDLTLASIYGDDVLVLDRGHLAAGGAMAETLTADLIRRVFKVRIGTALQESGAGIVHAVAQADEEAA
ncbi:ATP-binding cassette domain-containing protein [Labrys monachus]|uniref:Iron complex transport system ATP-binding protein n=1 Tax=Labrys monachus TaxID=217067 RepID=A0ABU0FAF7_9HYPH|nr:ATP-binding cassette domain-containing protein [Labrys monachus]MDQ0391580.1 iron complex transport system ATP-binding protein [Labrys monachus]